MILLILILGAVLLIVGSGLMVILMATVDAGRCSRRPWAIKDSRTGASVTPVETMRKSIAIRA